MRRLLLSVCGFAACLLSPAFAQDADVVAPEEAVVTNRMFEGDLVLRAGGGQVEYREDSSIEDIESDFDAPMATFGARFTYVDPTGFKLRASLLGWVSSTEDEEWEESGQLVQRNELQAGGMDVDGAFGLDLLGSSPQDLTLWLGLGYRTQYFTRSRFQSFGLDGIREADIGSVDEDYLVGRFTVGVDGTTELSPGLALKGAVTYGFVFFNEADNEVLGTIEGDGGSTLDLSVELSYAVSDRSAIGAQVRYDIQELDGDVEEAVVLSREGIFRQVAEWPDSELDMLSVDVFWKFVL